VNRKAAVAASTPSLSPSQGDGLTASLVERALAVRLGDLSPDALAVARSCVTDWLACGLAGLAEPVAQIVADSLADEGGQPQATLIGLGRQATVLQAALYNGTLSHALDYDDVNLAVPGHLSVAILPAVVALAERRNASGAQLLAAFAAGYETACRIGALVEPAHYANGFHATATIGGIGAAVACARLLELPHEQACQAVGIAATQSAGLKVMFGSMTKPLHAGLAAQAGLRAALLAARGLTSRSDAIECGQGFARVHGSDFHVAEALREPGAGGYLGGNLFKFHAACYSTHSTIEAMMALRNAHQLAAADVEGIAVTAGEGCSICNIQAPRTALEAKFSLRACAAFALLGIPTSELASWDLATQPEVVSVRDRVQVTLVPGMSLSESQVALTLRDGRLLTRHFDCGEPLADKQLQARKVRAKFNALAAPVLGERATGELLQRLDALEQQRDVAALMRLCGRPRGSAR
jgi:2-methylcitrate dehydratase PrpD